MEYSEKQCLVYLNNPNKFIADYLLDNQYIYELYFEKIIKNSTLENTKILFDRFLPYMVIIQDILLDTPYIGELEIIYPNIFNMYYNYILCNRKSPYNIVKKYLYLSNIKFRDVLNFAGHFDLELSEIEFIYNYYLNYKFKEMDMEYLVNHLIDNENTPTYIKEKLELISLLD